METLLSWVNQSRTIRQFGNEDFTQTLRIGDAVVLVKYALPNVLGNKFLLDVGLRIRTSLGKSDLIS